MTIRVEWKKLVPGFLKIAVQAYAGNTVGVVTGAIDTAGAFSWNGTVAPTAEEGAQLLLLRATYAAAMRTIGKFAKKAPKLAAEADPREMEAELTGLVKSEDATIELTADAFSHPERWPALGIMVAAFGRWQRVCGVGEDAGGPMRRAFQDEFPLALQSELRDDKRQDEYAALLLELKRMTPVDEPAERARHWMAYRARLVDAVHRPLRSLAPEIPAFSLSDLYVPLRAVVRPATVRTRRGESEEDAKPPIVWLHETLRDWIRKPGKDDTIRVLSGDPGAGKSSACTMLAAELVREGRRVLLVPLGRLDYNGDAWAELTRYVQEELGHDALDSVKADTGEPLVLILDGLDELAKAGQGAAEIVGQFAASLERRVLDVNRDGPRLLLLLAGRPGAVAATGSIARADGARLEVLRFLLADWDAHKFADGPLKPLDQRDDWWRRFDPVRGMPKVLAGHDRRLKDVTSQPLLNWLLAQVLTLEGWENAATIAGVHDLYSRLFSHVLDRVHRERRAETSDAVDRDRLERMLEEAAVAVWHRGERTVPLPVILKRLEAAELDIDLDRITKDRTNALTTLLDSFFCRAHSGIEHKVVEFTHKTFAEYLTARRIVREVADIHDLVSRKRSRHANETALSMWLDLCGPAAMDYDLLEMLRAEVAAKPLSGEHEKDVVGWRRTLTTLFQECVSEGMPWPGTANERARAAERRVHNAEVALLATLNATVWKTLEDGSRETVMIDWSLVSADKTLHRLLGPSRTRTIAAWSLSQLNLRGADLRGADLRGAGLSGADLSGADLRYANLSSADLSGADLNHAVLSDADLSNVDLSDADLNSANLNDANLNGAYLVGADLSGTYLIGADLRCANLIDAQLIGADLSRAELSDARLSGADLRHADLSGAKNLFQ